MNVKDLQFFHSLMDLNIQFFPDKGGKKFSLASGPLTQEEMERINISALRNSAGHNEEVRYMRDSSGLRFLTTRIDEGLLVIGPFISDEDSPPSLRRSQSFGLTIPIKSTEKIEAYNHLLNMRLRTEPDFDTPLVGEIETHNPAIESFKEIDVEKIDKRYANERLIRHLISSGSKKEMQELYKQKYREYDFDLRIPNNPLRVMKNYSIILNSISRLSAEKGGLPPFLLHSISEKYAIKIEEQVSEEGIRELQKEMLLHYCDAVHHYKIENHSAPIVKVIQYILLNLHRKIGLQQLADIAETSPSYLSRRFKEETGKTIWAYIREKRIIEARWMLSQTNDSITEIAYNLGYDDVNYFSKVFQKERGISPSEYRRKHWRDDFDGLPD